MINQIEMLKGCVNRMCVCKDKKELDSRYRFSKLYLGYVYRYNLKRMENDNTDDFPGPGSQQI